MNVQEGLQQLKAIKADHGDQVPIKVYIQTGPDSFEWKKVLNFVPFLSTETGMIIETIYGAE